MTSFNELPENPVIPGKGNKRRIPRSSAFDATVYDQLIMAEDACAEGIEDFSTFIMPALPVDQLSTQVHIRATYMPPRAAQFVTHDLTLSEQPTWIIPVIRAKGRGDNRRVSRTQVTADSVDKASGNRGVEEYFRLIRKLVKDSGIYALSSLAAPMVSLVLAPILTRFLTHTEYGALVILNTVIALIAGVTQLGLGDAFFRAYRYDYETERDRLDVLSTIFLLLFLTSLPVVLVLFLASSWLADLLFRDASLSSVVQVAAIVMLVQNLSVPGLAWLRVESHAIIFSMLSVLNLLVNAAATLLFVAVFHFGIAGSLMATAGGYAVIVVCTMPVILAQAGIRLRLDIAAGLFAFGFPHALNLIAGWVLQLIDRFLLGRLGSLPEAASYAVAYSLGGVLSALIIAPFSLAWWSTIYTIAKRDDAAHIFRLVFRWFSIVLLFATFGLSLLDISVLLLFFPLPYHSALPVIPVIALSTMFSGLFVVLALGISLQRKTWLTTVTITSSALLNVVLNLVLIPIYGAMGAALATLAAYILLAALTYFVNQRIYPVPFELGLFGIALLLGIVLYVGSAFLAMDKPIDLAWSIRIGALFVYGGCLLLLGKAPTRRLKKS